MNRREGVEAGTDILWKVPKANPSLAPVIRRAIIPIIARFAVVLAGLLRLGRFDLPAFPACGGDTAVPAGLANSHARIGFHELSVRAHGHLALQLPFSTVMIETPERALGPRRKCLAGHRIGQIRETRG